MQDFSTEYKMKAVFPCTICHNDDVPTPLEYAFGMLNVFDIDTKMELVGRVVHDPSDPNTALTWFGEGWKAGIEGDGIGESPWVAGNRLDILAWTIGYVSGRHASVNSYATPVCRYNDTAQHDEKKELV